MIWKIENFVLKSQFLKFYGRSTTNFTEIYQHEMQLQ